VSVEHVLQVVDAEGEVAREVPLRAGGLEIGRTASGIACPDDVDMAEHHARVDLEGETLRIRDSGEGSGVWLRIEGTRGRLLRSGDQIWLGAQILVVREGADATWQIRHHGPDGHLRETHDVPGMGLFVGRTSDLVLDLDDSRLSRRHAQFVVDGDGLRLYDRGAHNGTFVKLTADESLVAGDEFRAATSRFRYLAREALSNESDAGNLRSSDEGSPGERAVDAEPTRVVGTPREEARPSRGLAARLRRLGGEPRSADPVHESGPESELAGGTAEPDETVVDESGAAPVLIVLDSDAGSVSIETKPGKTILEAVREAGLERGEPVDWECGDGGCGVCVLGVVEGADRIDPPDPESGEMKTIQITEQVVPDPKRYRLACLARVRGTVRLRKLT